MQINKQIRDEIISALYDKLNSVIAARDQDAKDVSSKWNDAREERARQLDQKRDDFTEIIKVLSAQSGTISW